ncbi:MAG: PP2C family serine/threonine-protein phosphatase [Chloracidobacterium sp.]
MTTATTANGLRRIEVYALTDVGVVRPHNEDNFLIVNLEDGQSWTAESQLPDHPLVVELRPPDQGVLLAVSDGMGGALAGEVASHLAVTQVCDSMMRLQKAEEFKRFGFHEHLRFAIERANLFINSQSQRSPEYAGMGATFTGAGLDGTMLYLAQVGDSRAYLFRHDLAVQITTDQSLVEQLIQSGHITREEAETHPYKNVILQALGATPSVTVTVDSLPVCRDDVLLLCSDGLSGKINSEDMRNILAAAEGNLRAACQRMVELANERGGEDNITVVLLRFTGDGFPARGEVAGDDRITPIDRDDELPHPTESSLGLGDEPTQDEPESSPTMELTSEGEPARGPTPAELAITGGLGLTRQFSAVSSPPADSPALSISNGTPTVPPSQSPTAHWSGGGTSDDGLRTYRLVAASLLVILSVCALIWTFFNRKAGVPPDGPDPPRNQTHVAARPPSC